MKHIKFILSILMIGWGFQASATVTLNSVGGGSRSETVDGIPTLYGGYDVGNCNGTSVCNTCANKTGLTPCHEASIGPNVPIIIRATVSGSTTTATTVLLKSVKTDSVFSSGSVTLTGPSNGVITAQLPWSAVCAAGGGGSGCSTGFMDTLQFGVGTDSTTLTDKIEIKVVFAPTPTSSATVAPCATSAAAVSGEGACYFGISRGDEKVKITDLALSSDYPATGDVNTTFTDLVFYIEPSSGSGAGDTAAIAQLGPASASAIVGVSPTSDDVLSDDSITGLDNGQRYCFTFANRDIVGNIYRFADVSNATIYPRDTVCTDPQPVVGLLDDKRCFIATAAWGSPFHPHVQDLRAFRDQLLVPHLWGKSFVKWYYTHSPHAAHWIAEHPWAKMSMQVALWPLWVFAKLVLLVGWLGFLGLMLVGATGGFVFSKSQKQQRGS